GLVAEEVTFEQRRRPKAANLRRLEGEAEARVPHGELRAAGRPFVDVRVLHQRRADVVVVAARGVEDVVGLDEAVEGDRPLLFPFADGERQRRTIEPGSGCWVGARRRDGGRRDRRHDRRRHVGRGRHRRGRLRGRRRRGRLLRAGGSRARREGEGEPDGHERDGFPRLSGFGLAIDHVVRPRAVVWMGWKEGARRWWTPKATKYAQPQAVNSSA